MHNDCAARLCLATVSGVNSGASVYLQCEGRATVLPVDTAGRCLDPFKELKAAQYCRVR